MSGRESDADPKPSRLSRAANGCALLTAAIGLLVIAGWLLDIDPLKRVQPGLPAMKFNTALAFVAAGAGLWWRERPAPRIAAGAVVALLGALSLAEHLAGLDFGIDQLFVRELAAPPDAPFLPGRMAPTTAFCFLLLGLAMMGSGGPLRRPDIGSAGSAGLDGGSRRLRYTAELLALVAFVIGGFSLIGYPTGAIYLRQLPGSVGMGLNTAAAFVILGAGILCAADGIVVQTLRLRGTGRVLSIAFAVLTFLLVTVGTAFTVNIQRLAQDIDSQANVARPRREATLELENRVLGYVLAVPHALAGDAQARRAASDHAVDVDLHLADYTALATTVHQRALAARFAGRWRELHAEGAALLEAGAQPSQEELTRLATLRAQLVSLLEREMRPEAVEAFEAARATTLRGLRTTAGSPFLMLFASVVLALLTGGAVTRAVSRQEQTVREQREWLRVTLSSIGDGVIACDRERRVTFLNPVAESLTGWRAGEAKGQPIATVFQVINEKTREQAADIAGQVLREGRVVELANHSALVTRDGREVPIEDSAAPIADDTGKLTGVVLVFHDVTQRRRATDQLKESEARLSRSQEMAHLGSWELDLVRNQLTWSDEVYRIFGLEPQQFSATYEAFLEAVHPDDRAAVDAAYSSSVRDGVDSYEIEHRVVRRSSGETRTVHEKCQHVRDSGGRILLSLGMVHDITARKNTEAALRLANLQLAESHERKNEFLAVLSHELRNPLTPVRNSLQVLKLATPGSEQARRALEIIDRQTQQLARLVDDLLEVTRVTRNKIQLQRAPLELNDLVRRSAEDYRSSFEERGVALETDFAPVPLTIDGDAARLAQVVGNLLQNAAKFTPTGGRVVVSTSASTPRGWATLRIVDSGVGIEPAMILRLFQPFMQADATLDRSKGGLGLGLALVKALVEMHGGRVQAHSEGRGKGAELVVELPIDETPAAEVPPRPARTAASHRRVLIIEDNVDAADSLCEVLRLEGHEVEVAYSGTEGLALARGFRPEVVLCDIGLPGMDGYAVAREFRADDALRGVVLVALSGYALPEDLKRASEAGFERHLPKPPALEKLEQLLAEVAG